MDLTKTIKDLSLNVEATFGSGWVGHHLVRLVEASEGAFEPKIVRETCFQLKRIYLVGDLLKFKKTKEVCELKPEKSCKVEVVKRIRLVPRKVCTELKEPARESKLIRLKLPDEARTINLNNTNSVK